MDRAFIDVRPRWHSYHYQFFCPDCRRVMTTCGCEPTIIQEWNAFPAFGPCENCTGERKRRDDYGPVC